MLSDDVILFGAPLWTDMDRGNPLSSLAIRNGMTDFKLIKVGASELFTPEMAAAEFHKTVACLGRLAEENLGRSIVVMTHHAPSRQGLNSSHGSKGSRWRLLFRSRTTSLRAIPISATGSMDILTSARHYEIAQCKVMSNARGYYRHEYMAHTFNPDVSFEVEDRHAPAAGGIAPHGSRADRSALKQVTKAADKPTDECTARPDRALPQAPRLSTWEGSGEGVQDHRDRRRAGNLTPQTP